MNAAAFPDFGFKVKVKQDVSLFVHYQSSSMLLAWVTL